jgi:circadian clock protein KaiC
MTKVDKNVGENSLPKVPTHVKGLDHILMGGLPEGQLTLVTGGPGSGKSMLGIEFLYHEALAGNPGIFITFEERADDIRRNALLMGWDLSVPEEQNTLAILEMQLDPALIVTGDFDVSGLLSMIFAKSEMMGAKLIVLDAIDVLLQYYNDLVSERQALYLINHWLVKQSMTVLMTLKAAKNTSATNRYEFLDFMANCVIHLTQRVDNKVTTRLLRVAKYRGSDFSQNEFPYIIKKGGLFINAIHQDQLENPAFGPQVSSGHSQLDILLGGGYPRGSCVLIAGSTGTGKTTLASLFTQEACRRGEKVIYSSFEESPDSMMATMLSPGIDLRPAKEAGSLRFLSSMPESTSVEGHLYALFQELDQFKPDHLVVDAISACDRMGSQQHAYSYLITLLSECKKRGITTIFINQTANISEVHEITGIGVSSLVDSMLYLRFSEVGGELNRMLTVIKSRGVKHSNQFREYEITETGIEIKEVYLGEGGVLTGVTRQEQESREKADHQRRLQQIKAHHHELNQKRASLESETAKYLAEIEVAKSRLDGLEQEELIWREGRLERAGMRGALLENPHIGEQIADENSIDNDGRSKERGSHGRK